MGTRPTILVQLVHIEGPLKNEIQEFLESTILIGRHPSSDVHFPNELSIVSRRHAQIVREGNRFLLIDQSANGTFVNGKRVKETYLKDGDILVFAEGGPKLSFLTQVTERRHDVPLAPPPVDPAATHTPDFSIPVREPKKVDASPTAPRSKGTLVVQYGTTLQSFKELPVTIGKDSSCDFTLSHPGLLARQAQFTLENGQYWVRDLTGQGRVSVDGKPVQLQAQLNPGCTLALSPQGPRFRFVGGGRLAEKEDDSPRPPEAEHGKSAAAAPKEKKKGRSLFKRDPKK